MSAIRTDLSNRIHDRLFLWVKDSLALYKMAEMPFDDAIEDISLSMAAKLCQLLVNGLDFPPAKLAKMVYDVALTVERHAKREESR